MAVTIERPMPRDGSVVAHGPSRWRDGLAREALGRAAWAPAAGAPGLPMVLRDAAWSVDPGMAPGAMARPAVLRGAPDAEPIPARDAGTPSAPARDWTPEERAALARGAARGAADAGRGWVSDMVEGALGAATVGGQAAVVGLDAASRPPEPTGHRFVDALRSALREANPLDPVLDAVDALIPDRFAEAQARSLRDKGAALQGELAALPEVPRAVVEAFEAELALAGALEGAYLAGRADPSVLEESARVRGRAVAEMAILAAELGATAVAGAGAAAKAARALGRLDLGDRPGGTLAMLARGAEASRALAGDVRAFARGERGGAALGLAPGERLDRSTLDLVRAERRDPGLGAPPMIAAQWNDLRREAEALGVTIERLPEDKFQVRTAEAAKAQGVRPLAAFDPATARIVLREDATFYQGFHELQHARQWEELGSGAYGRLNRFERERYVFERIMENAERFTPVERGDAIGYIMDQARKPYGDPDFKLPTAYREDYEVYLMDRRGVDYLPHEMIRELDRRFVDD